MRRSHSIWSFFGVLVLMSLAPGFHQPARSQHTPTWQTDGRDLLGEALESVGFTRADLGYRPAGYWTRYPRVPYMMPFFDDLFSEPMRVYDYENHGQLRGAVPRPRDDRRASHGRR